MQKYDATFDAADFVPVRFLTSLVSFDLDDDLVLDKKKCSQFCLIVTTAHQILLILNTERLNNQQLNEIWLSASTHQVLSKS